MIAAHGICCQFAEAFDDAAAGPAVVCWTPSEEVSVSGAEDEDWAWEGGVSLVFMGSSIDCYKDIGLRPSADVSCASAPL